MFPASFPEVAGHLPLPCSAKVDGLEALDLSHVIRGPMGEWIYGEDTWNSRKRDRSWLSGEAGLVSLHGRGIMGGTRLLRGASEQSSESGASPIPNTEKLLDSGALARAYDEGDAKTRAEGDL